MKFHVLLSCTALTLLTACASPGNMIARNETAVPIVSGFTPIAVIVPPPSFCQGAASSDRIRAERAGFDAATLDRITLQSLQQCRTLMAGSLPESFERIASR